MKDEPVHPPIEQAETLRLDASSIETLRSQIPRDSGKVKAILQEAVEGCRAEAFTLLSMAALDGKIPLDAALVEAVEDGRLSWEREAIDRRRGKDSGRLATGRSSLTVACGAIPRGGCASRRRAGGKCARALGLESRHRRGLLGCRDAPASNGASRTQRALSLRQWKEIQTLLLRRGSGSTSGLLRRRRSHSDRDAS